MSGIGMEKQVKNLFNITGPALQPPVSLILLIETCTKTCLFNITNDSVHARTDASLQQVSL